MSYEHVAAAVIESIQQSFIPDGVCYGCGPANARGLGLRSYVFDGVVVADFWAEPHHVAVPGVVCGGVIGTLIDCHSGAALAQKVKDVEGCWPWAQSPAWATAEYSVKMLRPTPLGKAIRLISPSVELAGDAAVITVELHSDDKMRAVGTARWQRLRSR